MEGLGDYRAQGPGVHAATSNPCSLFGWHYDVDAGIGLGRAAVLFSMLTRCCDCCLLMGTDVCALWTAGPSIKL